MPKRSRDVGTIPRNETPKVGLVLRRAREYWKLSLREVERRTGRSNAYLSQVERGLIRQPDPAVLLELAELYKLDFMMLATWAGWANTDLDAPASGRSDSASLLIRRALELDDSQRTRALAFIDELLRAGRT
jgi:transcriptional regulator with XRE-family HTH domain